MSRRSDLFVVEDEDWCNSLRPPLSEGGGNDSRACHPDDAWTRRSTVIFILDAEGEWVSARGARIAARSFAAVILRGRICDGQP